MMKQLQLVIDCLLLSALVVPMALASNVADFVAHPFTTRSVVATISSKTKRPSVIMASRSVKSVSKHQQHHKQQQRTVPRFPNYAWEGGGNGSAASPEEVMAFRDMYQNDDINNDDHDHDHVVVSEDYEDDDYDPEKDLHLTQLLEEHALNSNDNKASVLYRYFGKSRSRLRNHDSIPFIFLGPSLDHWKKVGQTLASRGFSVMACESPFQNEDASLLVIEILEAFKWNRAILVGCDKEAVMAIRAALQLAPDRIAGLILCGDMTNVQDGISIQQNGNNASIDIHVFLQQYLQCPYSVIWDGAAAGAADTDNNNNSNKDLLEHHRCLIRGGGSAPHRRLPEQFAWALTRFVEEQVAPVADDNNAAALASTRGGARRRIKFMDRLVTPGGLLVAGRVLAEAVFYVSAMKVMLYQYENIYWGMSKVSSGYRMIFSAWPKRVFKLLGRALFVGTATSRRRSSDSMQDDDDDEPIIQLHPQDFFQQQQHQAEEQQPPVAEEEEEEEPVIEEEPEEAQPVVEEAEEAPMYWPIPLLNPIAV
jgi:hypothetical protein